MQRLCVYISAECRVCERTRQIVALLQSMRPDQPIELINLDEQGSMKPDFVFATPTYVLGNKIVSLGNPDVATLLKLLDQAN